MAGSGHDPSERSERPSEKSCVNAPGVGGISAKVYGDDDISEDDADEVMESSEDAETEEIENDHLLYHMCQRPVAILSQVGDKRRFSLGLGS